MFFISSLTVSGVILAQFIHPHNDQQLNFTTVWLDYSISRLLNRRSPLIQCREISRWQELPLSPSGYFWGQTISLSNPTTCSDVYSCLWQSWKIMLCKETKPAQTMTNNLKITGLTGCPNCWQKENFHTCNEHERWKPFPGAVLPLKPLLRPVASLVDLWAENRESARKQLLLKLIFWREVCPDVSVIFLHIAC